MKDNFVKWLTCTFNTRDGVVSAPKVVILYWSRAGLKFKNLISAMYTLDYPDK